jgi:tRNA threonylcarbamoyladenosine biosynthesis protein TsaB
MRTLRDLIAAHTPLLVIDAASAEIQVGWIESDRAPRWARSRNESGVGIFDALLELNVDPATVGAFVFCDGPGSILGVRTSAMTVRTWCVLKPRPVYAFHSLALVSAALGSDVTVIADARRDSWHAFSKKGALRRVPTTELDGALATPEGFRNWTPLPPGVTSTPYSLAELLQQCPDAPLFRETHDPDAFLHEEPEYVTWTPRVHRAP